MIGVIIKDIVGSRFENNSNKSKDFDLFTDECHYTDDTVMSLAKIIGIFRSEDISLIFEATNSLFIIFAMLNSFCKYIC